MKGMIAAERRTEAAEDDFDAKRVEKDLLRDAMVCSCTRESRAKEREVREVGWQEVGWLNKGRTWSHRDERKPAV